MIGEEIKIRRKQLGLTQEELVQKAYKQYQVDKEKYGVEFKIFDQAQLSKWENGEQIPNTKNLWLLSILLDMSFFELNTTEDSKIVKTFFHSGYCLAVRVKGDLNAKIHELLEYTKNRKIQEINQAILELYVDNKIEMSEDIAIMIPISYVNKEEGEEKYLSYILSFISGMNNGNIEKSKKEEE